MSLKSLTTRLKNRAADTPDPFGESTGYQNKAPAHAGCTPDTCDTSPFNDIPAKAPIGQFGLFGEAVNDPHRPAPGDVPAPAPKPAPGIDAGREPAPRPPADPNAWRVLSAAYQAHHFTCPVCIAASHGRQYGLRCGAGAALWTSYQNP